mmetsp:Transcript_16230/g.33347  ORF Transcript_16230/g.33347 Transcript_16230/m.33347 type:complete len:269 (-) Transcript_16230:1656-2462(-)
MRGLKAAISSFFSPLETIAAMTFTASLACSGLPSLMHILRRSSCNMLSFFSMAAFSFLLSSEISTAEAAGAMVARIFPNMLTMSFSSASFLLFPSNPLHSEKNSVKVLKHSPALPCPTVGKAATQSLTISRKRAEVTHSSSLAHSWASIEQWLMTSKLNAEPMLILLTRVFIHVEAAPPMALTRFGSSSMAVARVATVWLASVMDAMSLKIVLSLWSWMRWRISSRLASLRGTYLLTRVSSFSSASTLAVRNSADPALKVRECSLASR